MQTITTTKKEFGPDIYDMRYKYGYNWGCYITLGSNLITMAIEKGYKDKKTIDIGCGVGWFTDMYYMNVSRDIKGIDFSGKALDFHAKRMFPCIEFSEINIYNFDYTGYEVAIFMEVLEHIAEDKSLFSKLQKGCAVFCTVPFEKERQDITHVREYTISDVYKRYEDLLDIRECKKVDQYILFYGVKK